MAQMEQYEACSINAKGQARSQMYFAHIFPSTGKWKNFPKPEFERALSESPSESTRSCHRAESSCWHQGSRYELQAEVITVQLVLQLGSLSLRPTTQGHPESLPVN